MSSSAAMSFALFPRDDASVVVKPPLSQGVGYAVVVGIGLVIALGMVFVTRILKRTVGEDNEKTEM
jgi:hypothetical protein